MSILQELGISGGTALLVLIVGYFVIKWAIKNGVKEAYRDITENKTEKDLKLEQITKETEENYRNHCE